MIQHTGAARSCPMIELQASQSKLLPAVVGSVYSGKSHRQIVLIQRPVDALSLTEVGDTRLISEKCFAQNNFVVFRYELQTVTNASEACQNFVLKQFP